MVQGQLALQASLVPKGHKESLAQQGPRDQTVLEGRQVQEDNRARQALQARLETTVLQDLLVSFVWHGGCILYFFCQWFLVLQIAMPLSLSFCFIQDVDPPENLVDLVLLDHKEETGLEDKLGPQDQQELVDPRVRSRSTFP